MTEIYTQTIKETGIVPEDIYAQCSALVVCAFDQPIRRSPRPGQKPVRKRKS